jgi:putative tryptophan/tyrosine transport system substrate-binding protein
VRRRDVIAALGGAALAPFAARAQQAMPVVGFLRSTSLSPFESLGVALREGLKEAGFVEGKNVAIESRYADNQPNRLSILAAELVRLRVAIIVGNSLAAAAAKAATKTIPIVFAGGSDPVKDGLVPNLNRPGGNVTGISFLGGTLGTKRLALLRQFVPKATLIAVLVGPHTHETAAERVAVSEAARTVGQQIIFLEANSSDEIDRAFASAVGRGAGAMLIGSSAFMNTHRKQLVALAARHALPAMHFQREYAALGGLMSYGTDQNDAYRQAGIYAGRILKGEKPADLPVVQPTKFELVLNLKTAKALGLEIHPQLLGIADEVIE